MEKITPEQVSNWVSHPITQALLCSLNELKISNERDLSSLILNTNANNISVIAGTLAQLKGQVLILAKLIDLKEFLLDEVEIQEYKDSLNVEYYKDGLENL